MSGYQYNCRLCGKILRASWKFTEEQRCKCDGIKVWSKPVEELRGERRWPSTPPK